MKEKKYITESNYKEDDALDYETSRNYLIISSNKRAWLVAGASLFVAVLLAIALATLIPLKRVDLAVVKVDKNGFIDIITNLDEQIITKDEALDKHFIGKYVKTREQYFYNTLNQDYENVQMYSNKDVSNVYVKQMTETKTGKLDTLKNKFEIEAEILSIVLNDSNGTKTSTVRVELKEKDVTTNSVAVITKVITLTYEYINLKQNAKQRLENPLGFIVNSYRIDDEIKRVDDEIKEESK
ncbi:virB8 family protein [Arcobacter defluvii]|uniref:P-type type IV conjugative transfer system protein TrbF/VirB8 n=1 Tax=Arcobacter defluvii TaxID=873191 RepID=A0AAE7BGI5_9BACT|nr:type IV secretion system protein [Arcobacter defluvii]QKF77297.1 P-type type IV conjugative transfer system protein TrbF/VirB8 [Arcobacter defluvii]QKF77859.1 P-type type IV conjugative transfer system protein TrbF/VirB8 [Arcobacter defluvii]RXI29650.1 conjugal transfer protein TraJ [Arcobacter defluvii]